MSEVWVEPKAYARPHRARKIFQEFPEIPTRQFERKDFRMLVKVMSEVFAEWEGIGLCLEIAQKTMTNLGDKWKRHSNRGLISILDEWIKGNYGEKKLYPCWKSVIYLVADEMGGRNPAVARKIAQNWEEYEFRPYFDCPPAERADNTPLYKLKNIPRFIQDLYSDFLREVGQMWYVIGVLLGVPFNTLDTIDTKHDKLKEVINVWIDLYFSLEYLPDPTMRVLVDAVSHVMGGNNQGLAIKMAEIPVFEGVDGLQTHQQQQQQQQQAPVPDQQQAQQAPVQDQKQAPVHEAQQAPVQDQQQAQQLQFSTVATGEGLIFSTSMTVDQLHSWLLSNGMPQADCEIIKDKNINGMAFQYISESDWANFGISQGGVIVLKNHIMKQISGTQQVNGRSSNGIPSNGGASNNGVLGNGQSQEKNSTTLFAAYVSSLPASAHHLKQQLDWDSDLIEIAHHMLDWEEKLCTHLGLTGVDVHDIKVKHKDSPELQRRAALRRWKDKLQLKATYGNLLELFVKANHAQCANAVCEVLKKKK